MGTVTLCGFGVYQRRVGTARLVCIISMTRLPASRTPKSSVSRSSSRWYAAYEQADLAAAAGDRLAEARSLRAQASKEWGHVLHGGALRDATGFAMDLCLALKVPYVVAPAEADSQLAALARWGYISVVIAPSEDSDFIFYGCAAVTYSQLKDGTCRHCRVHEQILGHRHAAIDLDMAGWSLGNLIHFGVLCGSAKLRLWPHRWPRQRPCTLRDSSRSWVFRGISRCPWA